MDNKDIELVGEIYKATRKKEETIGTVLPKVYDNDLAFELSSQMNKYKEFSNHAKRCLNEYGVKQDPVSAMDKAKLWSKVQIETIFNTSTEHIADMMIQSSARNMVDMMSSVKDNNNNTSKWVEMAKELADFEENNIRTYKSYL